MANKNLKMKGAASMKKRFAAFFVCALILSMMLPLAAYADVGPKPSVRITFENMGSEVCYGTLLSSEPSTGPASAWDGKPEDIYTDGLDMDIWQAFADYQDPDGYYFLQRAWLCSESGQLDWTYYPPFRFKILLYYPASNTYTVSGICERYAFDSYFAVKMDGHEIGSVNDRAYDYTWELISLFCRIVVTIALELAVAWCFGLRRKEQVKIIFCVNLVTQAILNFLLNYINYKQGYYAFVLCYVLLELAVFVLEAAAYRVLFRNSAGADLSGRKIVLYALVANMVSFVGGMGVARIVPGIF